MPVQAKKNRKPENPHVEAAERFRQLAQILASDPKEAREFRIRTGMYTKPFLEGDQLYPGATFRKQTHVQICVRDMSCMKSYFRPMNNDGSPFQPS